MSNTNWICIAITEATYNDPEAMERMKHALCVAKGYDQLCIPIIGDKLMSELGMQRIETESGDVWYRAAPPLMAIVGDAGAFGPSRLYAAQQIVTEPTTILSAPVEDSSVIFEAYGIVPKPQEPTA